MTDMQGKSDRGAATRLQKAVADLVPVLEEKYWKTETMANFRSVFEESSQLLGKKMGVGKFLKERISLSAISEHYAKKKPEDVLAFLSRVDPKRFDGGHIITVGVGILYSYPNQDNNSQPGKLAMGFGVFNNGYISVPFEKIHFAAYHDPKKGLRLLRRSLAEKVERISKGDNPYGKKVDRSYVSASYLPPLPQRAGRASDAEYYRVMDMYRWQQDELEKMRWFYTSKSNNEPQNSGYWDDRLRDSGLSDDDIRARARSDARDPRYYSYEDEYYYRRLDEYRYP